jgi:hypothetical protein
VGHFPAKREHRLSVTQQQLADLDKLEAEVLALEAANPQPFPVDGAVCRCAKTGGHRMDCNLVIVGKLAGSRTPCLCWCHCGGIKRIADRWRLRPDLF